MSNRVVLHLLWMILVLLIGAALIFLGISALAGKASIAQGSENTAAAFFCLFFGGLMIFITMSMLWTLSSGRPSTTFSEIRTGVVYSCLWLETEKDHEGDLMVNMILKQVDTGLLRLFRLPTKDFESLDFPNQFVLHHKGTRYVIREVVTPPQKSA